MWCLYEHIIALYRPLTVKGREKNQFFAVLIMLSPFYCICEFSWKNWVLSCAITIRICTQYNVKKLLEQKKSTNLNFYEVLRSHRFLKLIKNHIEPRHHHYSSRILKHCSQFLSEDVYPINFHLPIHSRQLPIAPLFSLRQNFSPISSWLLIKNLSLCIDDDEWEIVRQYAPFTIQKSYHIEHR